MSKYRITFVLPSRGGGGGANSVIQEALGLSRLGVEISIAVNQANLTHLRQAYPELLLSTVGIQDFSDAEDLAGVLSGVDVVCATTALSTPIVVQALEQMKGQAAKPRAAYYIQDYEPLFYDTSTPEWAVAYASYTALPGAALFAKTEWLRSVVQENHNVMVEKVSPSLDHQIYYPNLERDTKQPVRISAMLRPRTRRRAPIRTTRILDWLDATFGKEVVIETFGASPEELTRHGLGLPISVINHGQLRRTEVPAVLRRSDLFLDLSDYQAFGRTALEAMASGCVPVMPLFGGATEFARHGWNGFMVDTRSDGAIRDAISIFMRSSLPDREMMRMNGLMTAANYSIHKAALSELSIFRKLIAS